MKCWFWCVHKSRFEMTHTTTSRDYAILAGILALAVVLRLIGLNGPLWYDEILTLETHLRLPFGDMMQTYAMNHHYLFSLQAKGAMSLFGEQAWAIRLPAMGFGVASIAAIWVLARDLAGRNTAHITALLLAISFHHIWFSQNARGYTELAFWSTLAMILYLRGLNNARLLLWLAYGFCLAMAIFTHLTGAFFFVAQGLVWLVIALRALPQGLRSPIIVRPAIGYLAGGALTLLLYAPVLPGVLETTTTIGAGSAVDVMQEYQNPVWTVIEAVRTAIGGLGPIVAVVALAVLGLVALGGAALWPRDRLFAPIVVLHIVLTMALLSALDMRIWPRFFFVDIGFLMLLIVLGVRLTCRLFVRLTGLALPVYGVAVVAMMLVSAGLAARNYAAPKQDLAGAYLATNDIATDAHRVYSVGVASTVFRTHFDAGWQEVLTDTELSDALAMPGLALFVVAFPQRYYRAMPALDQAADSGAITLAARFPGTLGDGAVLIFRKE